jgi:predicted transcriptional regulator
LNLDFTIMERREALKALAVLTGGAVLVPSCNFLKEDILAAYKNLQVTPSLQQLLASVADTIIPAGTIKGAADIAVQDFILVMVNDCLEPEEQKVFMQGLTAFNDYSKKVGEKSFGRLAPDGRSLVVVAGLAIERKPDAAPNETEDGKMQRENENAVGEFVKITKRFTIQGFMMSQYIMTEIKPYQIIPGPYQGAVLLSDIKKEVIHG